MEYPTTLSRPLERTYVYHQNRSVHSYGTRYVKYVSWSQVAIDVAIMATVAKSIRIYSIAVCPETTSTLFEESRKHNMTVLMGILINANAKDISAELSYLPKIMANYSDVVQAISVGNQALTGPKIGSKSRFASTMVRPRC